jgi:hypothetical protein
MIPKFASEAAANLCKLRNQDTGVRRVPMMSSSNRPRRAGRSWLAASFLALALIPSAKAVDPNEPLSVVLDQAQLMKLP